MENKNPFKLDTTHRGFFSEKQKYSENESFIKRYLKKIRDMFVFLG